MSKLRHACTSCIETLFTIIDKKHEKFENSKLEVRSYNSKKGNLMAKEGQKVIARATKHNTKK